MLFALKNNYLCLSTREVLLPNYAVALPMRVYLTNLIATNVLLENAVRYSCPYFCYLTLITCLYYHRGSVIMNA